MGLLYITETIERLIVVVVPETDFMAQIHAIASFLLLGKVFQVRYYFGIVTLILVSIGFCLADTHLKTRWKAFYLMSLASCVQAAALLLEESVFHHSSLFIGFCLITVGIILSGILPLLIRSVRRSFYRTLLTIQSGVFVLFAIELINLIALLMSQRAIALGVPSLVVAVETTIPAHTFILSVGLYWLNRHLSDARVLHHLRLKLLLLAGMMAGIWLVSY